MMTIYLNGDGATYLAPAVRACINRDVFKEDILRRAVEDIEEVHTIEGLALYSKRHGIKSPESLSNGMKALILFTLFQDGTCTTLLSNACMGANCAKYLQELSLRYDFPIAWDCFMSLVDDQPLSAIDAETGTLFTNGSQIMHFYAGKAGEPGYVPTVKYEAS